VPAAAVIPAPQVYIYFAEFKKLVVGSACSASGAVFRPLLERDTSNVGVPSMLFIGVSAVADEFTLNKLECSTQAFRLYISAWNNRIGPRFYFVGFRK
jgi:hypothetical protein